MKLVVRIAIAALPLLLAGCGTMHGMGDDMSNAWHGIFG